MSGLKSRRKGQSAEREFVKLISDIDPEAKRVPLSGAQDGYANDVVGLGLEWEIKRRKSGFKQLYDWLNDTRENPDAVALRTDHNDWVVCMKLDKFKELMTRETE